MEKTIKPYQYYFIKREVEQLISVYHSVNDRNGPSISCGENRGTSRTLTKDEPFLRKHLRYFFD